MIITETIKSKQTGIPTTALIQLWNDMIEREFIQWEAKNNPKLDEHLREDLKSYTFIKLHDALHSLTAPHFDKANAFFTLCIKASVLYCFVKERKQQHIAMESALLPPNLFG